MSRWKAAGLHVAFIAAIYCCCPVATSGDSKWVIPIALNMVRHGSVAVGPEALRYPVAVSAIAVPLLVPIEVLSRLGRPFASSLSSPTLRAFFQGDFLTSSALVEMLEASMLVAIAAGVQLLIGLEFLPLPRASLLTFIFAFATPAWSTASRAMWNHTPALLMLMFAIYFLILARRKDRYAAYASIPLELAFMTRPSMAIALAALTLYVAIYHRDQVLRYLLLATPLALVFFAYNLHAYGHLFQTYFTDPGAFPTASWPERFSLQLISPSRGLFIFCPIVAFSFWGMWTACRKRWLYPLTPWLIALVIAQVALVTKYYWPGYSYGPRYFTEAIPLFTLFLIPMLQSLPSRLSVTLFAVALAWSVFVEARGATDFAVHDWNGTPTDVNLNTSRVWDWHDPQFLRGLR